MQMLTRSGWTPSNDIEVSCSLGGKLLKLVVCTSKHVVVHCWNMINSLRGNFDALLNLNLSMKDQVFFCGSTKCTETPHNPRVWSLQRAQCSSSLASFPGFLFSFFNCI